MDTILIDKMFIRIDARLKVADRPARRSSGVVSLDVQADRKGEFFEIVQPPDAEAEIAVLDVQPPTDICFSWSVRARTRASSFANGKNERRLTSITVYRNGKPYGSSFVPGGKAPQVLQTYQKDKASVYLCDQEQVLTAEIVEAHLYKHALSEDDVATSYRLGITSKR
jgi:hypothetical protein